jgi:group II intron reverse transcriptase/maturase
MYEQLMELVVEPRNARAALEAVKGNHGAAGIDGMTTDQLGPHLKAYWEIVREKLLKGKWTPSPLRRVEIPKPDGGIRTLGIPTVMDRFVQQMLLQVLTPIFEEGFSPNSYGFRPGRNAHDAIRAAQSHVEEGYEWVVDIDIAKFFDHVHHDILMGRLGSTIRDKRVLKLIGRYLRRGAMIDGVAVVNEEGTPQGGPLSPLLGNIYLDMLDKELEARGHRFSRYADDCNIYVRSETAATRVMENIRGWIERRLKLQINETKSGVGKVRERKFLGFVINRKCQITVAESSLQRFTTRVRELWKYGQSRTSNQLRDQWQRYIRGWWNYYGFADDVRAVQRLEGWIRRHIRKTFWLRWHGRRGRRRRLGQLGLHGESLRIAGSGRGAWRLAMSPQMHSALNNATLRRYGFLMPSDLRVPSR